jgi:hypothetical protein
MAGERKRSQKTRRVLAFALALLFLAFFTQVATHTHQNGHDDATCQVCQGAHVAPAPLTSALAANPLHVLEYVRLTADTFLQEVFLADCPSRAPPTLFS